MDNIMNISINVNVGLTPQLEGFLIRLFGGCHAQPVTTEVINTEAPQVAAPAKPETVKAPQPMTVEEATAEPEPQAVEDAPQATATEEREYTEADVRAAIDRARQRIEGDDWKDNPDGAGYKKWHRAMTSWFKVTAALFGADRPSELPDSHSRMGFIRCCDEVQIVDGALQDAVPF